MNICWTLWVGIFLFLTPTAFAQKVKPKKSSENLKQWKEGKLTWNDFQRKPPEVAPTGSEFIFTYYYQPEKVRTADTSFYKVRAIFGFNRQESWAHDSVKTDLNLNYNQVFFNTLEWHRRALENRFLKLTDRKAAPDLLSDQNRLMRDEVAKLAVITKNGRDESIVNKALTASFQKLDSIKTSEQLPPFRVRKFGYGVHFGLGQANLVGDLRNGYDNFLGLALGLDFHYKALAFFLTTNIGSGETTGSNVGKYKWPAGLPVNLAQVSAAFGLPILNTTHWRMMPFAGPARLSLGPDGGTDEIYQNQRLAVNTMAYGLQVDWKIRNALSLILTGADNLIYDYGLRTQFIYYPVKEINGLNGGIYNVSMSFFLNNRFIQFKK